MSTKEEDQLELELQQKGLSAPRLNPQWIDGVIKEVDFIVHAERFTICILTLQNGFIVTGENAPASSTNFDPKIGKSEAYKNAREKIWELEGYLLKQRLYEESL